MRTRTELQKSPKKKKKKSPILFFLCPKDWMKDGGSTCKSLSASLKLSLQSGRTGCGVLRTISISPQGAGG